MIQAHGRFSRAAYLQGKGSIKTTGFGLEVELWWQSAIYMLSIELHSKEGKMDANCLILLVHIKLL